MSVAPERWAGKPRWDPWGGVAVAVGAGWPEAGIAALVCFSGATALVVALLLVEVSLGAAILLALAPLAVVLGADRSAIYVGLLAVLAALVSAGRDFAYIPIGPFYVMEGVLVAALILLAPDLLAAVSRRGFSTAVLVAIILITVASVIRSGVTYENLRQAVIGLYAFWAFVGAGIAFSGRAPAFAKAVFLGSAGATVIYGAFLVSQSNSFTTTVTPRLINAAQSLYVAFAILMLLFARNLLQHRRLTSLAILLAVVQSIELVLGQVRSIWVALFVAILATSLLMPIDGGARRRVAGFSYLFVVLALTAALAVPDRVAHLGREAQTIVDIGDDSLPGANSRWRLRAWHSAFEKLEARPLDGIGFGGAAVDVAEGSKLLPSDPHNSFVTFALRLGLPAFLLLLAFQALVVRAARQLARSAASTERRQLVTWLFACQVLVAVHACFTVVLEGPYMGIFYWLFGGVLIGLDHVRRTEQGPGSLGQTDPLLSPAPSAGAYTGITR